MTHYKMPGGLDVPVIEHPAMYTDKFIIDKSTPAIYTGCLYRFMFATQPFDEAVNYCFIIASDRVKSFIQKQ